MFRTSFSYAYSLDLKNILSTSFTITIDQNQLKLTSNNTPSNPINSFTKLCTNSISQTINVMIIVCSVHVKLKNG